MIKILPHHLLNFYLEYWLKRLDLYRISHDYGEEYANNVKDLCEALFLKRTDVEIKLWGEDSICLPNKSKVCMECRKRREGWNELKRVYYRIVERLDEMRVLTWFDLKPGQYCSREITEKIKRSGRKLKPFLPKDKDIQNTSFYLATDIYIKYLFFPIDYKIRKIENTIKRFWRDIVYRKEKYKEFKSKYSYLSDMDDKKFFEYILSKTHTVLY